MNRRAIGWLYAELPGLVAAGVLTPEAADRLRAHYGAEAGRGRRLGVVICSILGALLIGAGIILLLAHNWSELSRPARTLLSLAPLLAAQAFATRQLTRPAPGPGAAAREGIGLFWSLALAAAIALIGQTYHIPGDLGGFLLTWALLTLPIAYLLKGAVAAGLYLVLITAWAGYAQGCGGHAVAFWPLFAALLPYAIGRMRANRYGPVSAWLGWILALCLCVATGITLEKVMPGLWIVIYASLFGILYLAGGYWFAGAPSAWQRPFHVAGACGGAALAFLLTWEWPWDDVGWHFARHAARFHAQAAWLDYAWATVLPVTSLCLLVTAVRRRQPGRLLYGVLPLLAIPAFAFVAGGGDETGPQLLFNFYLFVAGAGTIIQGARSARLALVNGGMVMITALIVARFLDDDFSLVVRGIAFILIGAGFLATNLVLARRLKGPCP